MMVVTLMNRSNVLLLLWERNAGKKDNMILFKATVAVAVAVAVAGCCCRCSITLLAAEVLAPVSHI
jgi:hypothetical protein